jgi:CHC2 zinc finger
MSATSKVLDRVECAKQTRPGRWVAKCPAHEDKSPSLSIRETDEGRCLLHCFGGCATSDVLAAIGLSLCDLFDKPLTAEYLPPVRGGFTARELLEINSHEATVVSLLAEKAAAGTLTAEDIERLTQASARLSTAQALVHGR